MKSNLLSAFLGTMVVPAIASAAITASWRINPISQAAIDDSGGLLTHALSVSLMVELTGYSRFSAAGLCVDHAYQAALGGGAPRLRYYQRNGNGASENNRPPAQNFPLNPALEFDTYVAPATNSHGQGVAVPADYFPGTGGAQIGGTVDANGPANQIGFNFNVTWVSTPATGMQNTYEIARLTFVTDREFELAFIPLSLNYALVQEEPGFINASVPPIPVPLVPEPQTAALFIAVATCVTARRAR